MTKSKNTVDIIEKHETWHVWVTFEVVDASSHVYESVRKEVTYTALHKYFGMQ